MLFIPGDFSDLINWNSNWNLFGFRNVQEKLEKTFYLEYLWIQRRKEVRSVLPHLTNHQKISSSWPCPRFLKENYIFVLKVSPYLVIVALKVSSEEADFLQNISNKVEIIPEES